MGGGTGSGRRAAGGGRAARRIIARGVVQGVGFRPFVCATARRLDLGGTVQNTSSGVVIEVEGDPAGIERLLAELRENPPPLARIEGLEQCAIQPAGRGAFTILPSAGAAGRQALIPPDVATCPDCRREVADPADRHHRYPFTNCTACGPRFTIIMGVPYDRDQTTMRAFSMCPDCAREYHDQVDRRFHAQPVACPACGPRAWAVAPDGTPLGGAWDEEAARVLRGGGTVAVKGLGGFHLACDALSAAAVERLRGRKDRPRKPLAVMARDLDAARRFCVVSDAEAAALLDPAAPILALEQRPGAVPDILAPGLRTLGVMLPYTPLHLMLFARGFELLVMTSGNEQDQPLVRDEGEAQRELAGLCDLFVFHNREIHQRCDDSVGRVVDGELQLYRRSRGFVPSPVDLPAGAPGHPPLLATGGDLKNAFALGVGRRAFLSQHIGDLASLENELFFREALERLARFLAVTPRIFAYDMHPGYMSTRLAADFLGCDVTGVAGQAVAARAASGVAVVEGAGGDAAGDAAGAAAGVAVQHHHAHMASCMADNGLVGEVVGVSADGTGYGLDGAVWGFEVLSGGYGGFRREYHLAAVPLIGGEAAAREPPRMALAHLLAALGGGGLDAARRAMPRHAAAMEVWAAMAASGFNSPPTTSCGRLFDAAAALLGICDLNTYEAQAAFELTDLVVSGMDDAYPFAVREAGGRETGGAGQAGRASGAGEAGRASGAGEILAGEAIAALAADVARGTSAGIVATRFHNTVAGMMVEAAARAAARRGLRRVVLGGGTFQNPYLLLRVRDALRRRRLDVYWHHRVPAGDGGLALGQAAVALCVLGRGGRWLDDGAVAQ